MRHTPGPWTTDDGHSDCFGVFASDDNAVCYLSEHAEHGNGLRGPETDLANARLIAAAPELAAVLRALVRQTAGAQGIDSPRAPDPALLHAAVTLLAQIDGTEGTPMEREHRLGEEYTYDDFVAETDDIRLAQAREAGRDRRWQRIEHVAAMLLPVLVRIGPSALDGVPFALNGAVALIDEIDRLRKGDTL